MVSGSARTLPWICTAVIVPPTAAAAGPRWACAVVPNVRIAATARTAQRKIKLTPGHLPRRPAGQFQDRIFIDRQYGLSYPFVPGCPQPGDRVMSPQQGLR